MQVGSIRTSLRWGFQVGLPFASYIHELQRKAARQNDTSPQPGTNGMRRLHEDFDRSSPSNRGDDETLHRNGQPDRLREGDEPSTRATSEEPALTNFLATDCSTFMTANNGMTFYLGSTSNWTFTQKILSMVYERVCRNRLPDMSRNIEGLGNAYDLQWDGAPIRADPDSAAVPTIDHAIYLINAVKFHCAQLFHVFDEDTFMPALYNFYENPDRNTTDKVWLVHFMVILAFGKGFTVNKNGKDPPGVEYFIQALQLLPNMIMLWRYPVHSVEVLTCIALYLTCLDYRIVAHNFVRALCALCLL
jgi:proline utilization trans-activator